MELYKTFIKNNRAVLIGHLLIYAQGIILMPIIIKTVGINIYGGYILVSTLVNFIYGVSSFGVGFRCGRFLPSTEKKNTRGAIFNPQFYFHLLSIILLSLAFMFSYAHIDKLFFKGELIFSKWLIFPYLFSVFLYSQTANYFLSTHRMNHFNYATALFPYINILLVILSYLSIHNLSINLLFLTQTASYLLIAIPLTIMLIRETGLKFSLPNQKNLVDDIRLGFPLRINYVMDFLLSSSDRYLITYFLAVSAVGYYNPGYALGSLIIFFPRVSSVVLTPLLSKAVDSGRKLEARTMLNYTIKGFFLLAFPFIIATVVMSKQFLNLFANVEVSQKACVVTPVIAIATIFFGLNIILSNVLWIEMKTSILLKINALGAAFNLTLNLIFFHIFKNILVAAFTTLVSYAIVFVFIYKVVIKDWPVHFEFTTMIKLITASVFMGVILYCINLYLGDNAFKVSFMLCEVVIGAAVYILTLFAIKTFSPKELAYLRKVFS